MSPQPDDPRPVDAAGPADAAAWGDEDGVPLAGGRVAPVVRVGDTVRRSTGPWTPAVHELLAHLQRRGFTAAPRPLGIDARGREVLSHLPGQTVGDAEPYPAWVWSDATLREVAVLLRDYHEAVRDFRPAGVRHWRSGPRVLHERQLICHNDVAPYNVVHDGARVVGIIDWDVAGPGLPSSDLAFTAWQFVPLMHPDRAAELGAPTGSALGERLELLLDAYGLADRDRFAARVVARIRSSVTAIRGFAAAGQPAFVALVEQGYVDRLLRDADWILAQGW